MRYISDTQTVPTGSIRTVEQYGIPYIIGTPAEQLLDGDWLINIELPESGEKQLTSCQKSFASRKPTDVRQPQAYADIGTIC